MNKKYIATILVICLTFFAISAFSTVQAQAENQRYSEEIDSAGALMLGMRIAESERMMERFIEVHPEDPAGYFYRASAAGWRIFLTPRDSSIDSQMTVFEQNVRLCKRAAEEMQKDENNRTEALAYLGMAHGQEALLALLEERYLVALPRAIQAWKYLQRVLERDPAYYDIYFGVGVYRYFAAQLPGVVETLAGAAFGLEGDRSGGMDDLRIAAAYGLYSRDAARMMLLNIYGTFERPDSFSAVLASDLRSKYRDNPLVHWRYGDVLRRAKHHAEAEAVYREVLALIDSGKPGYRNRMYSRWSMIFRIGWMRREQKDYADAVKTLSRVTDEYESGREVWPEWVVAYSYLQLAEAYLSLDKPERVRENINKVLEMRDMRGSHKKAKALEGMVEKL